jgi:hypothetical protein
MSTPQLLDDVLNDPSRKWTRQQPASEKAITQLCRDAGIELPQLYLDFLRWSNGGEGEFGIRPGWFQLWPAEEVLESHRGYAVPELMPGFFAFASDGGGDLFVFDTRGDQPWAILCVDACSLDVRDTFLVGIGFESFIIQIGREWKWTPPEPPKE